MTVILRGIFFLILPLFVDNVARAQQYRAYIGTYTGGSSQGIYVTQFDSASGKIGDARLAAETRNPSFLAIHPTGKYLYAVGELEEFEGEKSGAVTAFKIDQESADLHPINHAKSSGEGPCHLVVDHSGRFVLIANYGSGTVSVIEINPDGSLGKRTAFHQHTGSSVNPARQKGPHAHSINVDAQNRFAFAADLGLDKILIYRFNPQDGSLEANKPPFASVAPGSGPRHFSFAPSGKFAYVINEMALTVTGFAYDSAKGSLESIQTISTVPDGEKRAGLSTAEVVVHPSGKFLYGSNRGHDSIAVFRIDPATGKLSFVECESTRGKTPRNFAVDPSGKYLLAENQGSDSIVILAINPDTGELDATGESVSVPSPVCVKFLAI
jgi:6-phosphogluconolactonase